MGGLKNHGKHIYKLNRTKKERWHLNRTLVTQLVEHERITTTITKTKGLRALAERVMVLAKRVLTKNDENARRELQGILTTSYARTKIVKEIAPRFNNKNNNFTRIVDLNQTRKGDNASLGYIEIIGNDLERYEATQKEQKIRQGIQTDVKSWHHQVLKEERDFLQQQLEQAEEQLSQLNQGENNQSIVNQEQQKAELIAKQGAVDFFKQKIARVEHDLFIANKNPFDIQRLPNANFVQTSNLLQNQSEQKEN